jgi:hypothetical protein
MICIGSQLHAQINNEDYLGSWYTIGLNHQFTEKFSLTPYAELRFYEPTTNYNLTVLNLRGNYQLKGNHTIGIGYAYLNIDSVFDKDQAPNIIEHRIQEQYTNKHALGTLNLQHRFRFEQRFLAFSNRNDLQHRFRYKLSLKFPINKTYFLALCEEVFVNFQDQVFHENRFNIGFGFNLLKQTQLKIGYLKQHIRKQKLNRIQIGISFKTQSKKHKSTLANQ